VEAAELLLLEGIEIGSKAYPDADPSGTPSHRSGVQFLGPLGESFFFPEPLLRRRGRE
jgi:hypothetical protein